ncbi:metallophosphoesterase [Tessaracoccus sp. Y1736]
MTRPVLRAVGATAALGAACFGWGLIEAALFTVRQVELPILPAGGRPIRILHMSDIHLTTSQHFKLDFIRSMAALEPDLVINTGDNIAQAEAVFPLLAAWNKLRFVPGVFVFGSNDYFKPHFRNPLLYLAHGKSEAKGPTAPNLPWEKLRDGMTKHGWVDLTHRRAALEVNGYRLAFRGVDDAHLGRDRYAMVEGPADASADLNIGVTHAPYLRLLDAMTADGMDLIFAGHTHGGQVCVPGYGALITNCDLDPARVKGLSTHTAGGHTAHLHVSAGVGTSPFAPYRFACRPEVTLLTLRPVSR